MADGPHELHLTQHRTVAWMLFPAGAIACITLGVWVGSALESDPGPDASTDWTVPGIAIGTLCAALLVGRAGTVVVELDPLDRRLSGSGWSLLELTFDSKIARTLAHKLASLLRAGEGRHLDRIEVFFVRVPPDATPSAGDVAATLEAHWLAPTRR
jgi:hypothetical protein